MVSCHSGQSVHATQLSTENLSQGHDPAVRLPVGDADYAGQSTLRALLLLSGAATSMDAALARTSDADTACFSNIVALLGRGSKSTHAA